MNTLKATYEYCLINNDVYRTVYYLLGSVRDSDFIPFKTLSKTSVKYPPFLPPLVFSLLFNKGESESLCQGHSDTEGQTDSYDSVHVGKDLTNITDIDN